MAAFVIVLIMILVIVIATPNDSNSTPVMKEVKKTMSYARMSSHLLTPLMECDEDPYASFMGSHAQFHQTVCELCCFDV